MLEEFRLKNDLVELYKIPNFLNDTECNHLVQMIDRDSVRSRVSASDKEFSVVSDYRTSSTCVLPISDLTVQVIDQKIRTTLNTTHQDETIQGQKYETEVENESGQYFKAHCDYFSEGSYLKHCTEQNLGNRSWTFMIYLNDVELGGETEFPKLGLKFKPQKGTAIIWKNSDEDGKVYPDTLHSGNPVLKGNKYIITKWFRNPIVEAELPNTGTKSFDSRYNLDKFTEKGFTVMDVPQPLWGIIQDTHKMLEHTISPEQGGTLITSKEGQVPSDLINLGNVPNIRSYMHHFLQPIHEKWCRQELEMTYCYGIRSYNRGAKLGTHVDRIATHHISCIILVAEKSDEPWPLQIMNNSGAWEEVFIKPGQMILYESATCEHGRIKEFRGDYFRNFFVHYKLKNYVYNG